MRRKLFLSIIIGIGFLNQLIAQKLDVYVFVLEECLITQDYMPKIKELALNHRDVANFTLVFPHLVSSDSTIATFLQKYQVNLPVIKDRDKKLTFKYGITVTPEVVIVSSKGDLMYRGRIDDQFYAIGRRRRVLSSDDLNDILNLPHKTIVKYEFTTSIGCLINLNEKDGN
jgi:hypothetical protein